MFENNTKTQKFQQELYRQHYKRIYNTCLRIIGNPLDAEEIMHDVFLKVFDKIDNLQNECAFVAWSQSIAMRMSIDVLRKKGMVFADIENLQIIDNEMQITEDKTENNNAMDFSVENIKEALTKLADGYRIVLSMRLFEEREFEEIAEILKIKESSVRSQYARGREKLVYLLKKNKIENNE